MVANIRTDANVLPDIAEPNAELRAEIRSAMVIIGITIGTIVSSFLAILLHLS